MMTDLVLASWETMARRSLLIMQNKLFAGGISANGQRESRGGCEIRGTARLRPPQSNDDFAAGTLAHSRDR